MMRSLFVLVCLAAFSVQGTVVAQDAMGAGNVLDANLGVGTGGIIPNVPVPDYRARNLIITGDVIGGRGFRGSVGYAAEGDFRDRLGSNDLFRFRADSAISVPQISGLTIEQLRTGQEMGLVEYRRAGSADPAAISAQFPIALPDAARRLSVDRRLLSSSQALTRQEQVEPKVVGTRVDEQGRMIFFNASPIQGLTYELASQSGGMAGFNQFDMARIREDIATGAAPRGIGGAFQTRFENLPDEPPPAAVPSGRVDNSVNQDYRNILARIAERYADQRADVKVSPELVRELDQDYQQLRDRLSGRAVEPTAPGERGLGTDFRRVPDPRDPNRERERPESPSIIAPPTTRPEPSSPTSPEAQPAPPAAPDNAPDYGAILRHGQRIDRLSEPTRNRFNELMTEAEQSLRTGEYFTAELRFDRALRFIPGHPLATAGGAHAQLGAGLYLSASLTLRHLFTNQPEMIDVVFAPDLLPNSQRLEAAVTRLREHLRKEDTRDWGNYGFLLAYIGHQRGDRDLVKEGLDAMAAGDPNHPLLALLRQIWLVPPGAPKAPPTTAPAPTPPPTPAEPEK